MKVVKISAALKTLRKINEEIRYAGCFDEKQFTGGVIAFRLTKSRDSRQVVHEDQDVVCQVLEGSGRLRLESRRIPLRPGMVCHIPKGLAHDFAAGKSGDLVLFYLLIRTG